MDKLVSVIIPTFNRRDLTTLAIESVVASSPERAEIIVIDDCGKDEFEFVSPLNASGVTVRVVRLTSNVGASCARTAGVRLAKGKIVAFLDSDDVYLEGWVDYLITIAAEDSCSKMFISGRASNGHAVYALTNLALSVSPDRLKLFLARFCLIFFNPFYTPAVAMSVSLYTPDDSLRYCEDYYLNSVALLNADKLLVVRRRACALGRHPGSGGGLSGDRHRMQSGEDTVRLKLRQTLDAPSWWRFLFPVGAVYQRVRERLVQIIRG